MTPFGSTFDGVLPSVLILGFAAGLLSQRLRTLSLAILGLGFVWACLIASDEPAVALEAFALGAANAAVGVVASALPLLIVERLRPTR